PGSAVPGRMKPLSNPAYPGTGVCWRSPGFVLVKMTRSDLCQDKLWVSTGSDSRLKESDIPKPEDRSAEQLRRLRFGQRGIRLAAMGDVIAESAQSIESAANMVREPWSLAPIRYERHQHVQ